MKLHCYNFMIKLKTCRNFIVKTDYAVDKLGLFPRKGERKKIMHFGNALDSLTNDIEQEEEANSQRSWQ